MRRMDLSVAPLLIFEQDNASSSSLDSSKVNNQKEGKPENNES